MAAGQATINGVNVQLQNIPAGQPGASPTPTNPPAPITPTTNPPVNTSQPNPATVNATPTTNPPPVSNNPPVYNAAQNAFNATNPATPAVSNNQAALNTAKASGPPPQDAATANTAVTNAQAANPPPPDTAVATNALAQDPGYQKLVADATAASNTVTQGQTLLQQYQQMEQAAGIPAINTQLLSTQAIINGTEDDIRNEVQAANGFATNSQVLALSDARNKTLIQNYNNLLATKTNAESQINTMIGLAGQDKQNAIAAANEQLNIDTQLNDYAQKFQANAQQAYGNIIQAVGYSGLTNSLLNSDPSGKSLALAEQTLGMQPGQLQNVATQEQSAKNLAVIQAAGVTSPFVVTSQGEVWNSQTGYAYTSPEDFQAKTGMTLQQATAKNAIQPPPANMDALIKQAQLSKAQTDAQYAGAQAQANINQSNASAGASAASAAASRANTAKTQLETGFEQANGGLTQADALKQGQDASNDAATYIAQLGAGKIKWNDAFNAMKSKYFPTDNSQQAINTIDNLLQAGSYRPKP